MLERELKLSIPKHQQAKIMAAVQAQPAHTIHLAAQYFDTPDRQLACQGAALRLRLENEQWVQTLKMRGPDTLSHLELNHIRPDATLDLSLYATTAAAALFEGLTAELQLRYQTQVQRTVVTLLHEHSTIEIALDIGHIQAQHLQIAISEIEFELKKGAMEGVFSIAADYIATYGLAIELRTKSERGDALYEYAQQHTEALNPAQAALALALSPYRLGPAPILKHPTTVAELYLPAAERFLSQIIRNAAFLADIDHIQASPELQADYLMLMRVGMRRLHACARLFKPWLSASEWGLEQRMRHYFKKFGQWRDLDLLQLELGPRLQKAGLELPIPTPTESMPKSADVIAQAPEFQQLLLLRLRQLVCHQALKKKAYTDPKQLVQLERRLHKRWKSIRKHAKRFDLLTPKAQHKLRNKIKHLRYSLEAVGYDEQLPLYIHLGQAQDQLGDLCDVYVAKKHYASTPSPQSTSLDWFNQKISKYQNKGKKTLTTLRSQRLTLSLLTD